MNERPNPWLREEATAYRVRSRNGAVALWLGLTVLLGLFYSAIFQLVSTWLLLE